MPLVRLCRVVAVHAKPGDVLMAVDPRYPFLEQGRIETALLAITAGLPNATEAAVTVYGTWSLLCNSAGENKVIRRAPLVDACVAVLKNDLEMGKADFLGMSVHQIPLEFPEIIDISTPRGMELAEIAACYGT
jgi:hypothetical protein